ncbi:hypothetical protein Plhal304r1_c014g0051541 [Plasmopara halstedii]
MRTYELVHLTSLANAALPEEHVFFTSEVAIQWSSCDSFTILNIRTSLQVITTPSATVEWDNLWSGDAQQFNPALTIPRGYAWQRNIAILTLSTREDIAGETINDL